LLTTRVDEDVGRRDDVRGVALYVRETGGVVISNGICKPGVVPVPVMVTAPMIATVTVVAVTCTDWFAWAQI
jgi:hypothetical protein